jgi:hypothetical protein
MVHSLHCSHKKWLSISLSWGARVYDIRPFSPTASAARIQSVRVSPSTGHGFCRSGFQRSADVLVPNVRRPFGLELRMRGAVCHVGVEAALAVKSVRKRT